MRQILLGIHIFLAIVWVGGILFIGWGVYPVARTIPFSEQRRFLHSLMKWSHMLFLLAGCGVIVTGVLLGTAVGPIRKWHDLWHTSYGSIWFASFVIALLTLAWGAFVGYRKAAHVFSDKSLWQRAERGETAPLRRKMATVIAIEAVEVLGFIILIVCMILL